jgi:hypothetical protein
MAQARSRTERVAELAHQFCKAVVDSETTRLLTPQDLLAALPLAVARYIGISMPGANRPRQVASAEALLRYLGRGLLSASYDHVAMAGLFEGSASADGQPASCAKTSPPHRPDADPCAN